VCVCVGQQLVGVCAEMKGTTPNNHEECSE
jgi:hypothetical protein